MSDGVFQFLLYVPALRFLRVIFYAQRQYSLRQIAVLAGMSPSTASGVACQLVSEGIIQKNFKGKRTYYNVSMSDEDKRFLESLFDEYEKNYIRAAAKKSSTKAVHKISWIDEMLVSIREAKSELSNA